MSKDIDEQTMGRLIAGGSGGHAPIENPSPDILLAGSIEIRNDPADLGNAEALRAMVDRAIEALRRAAPAILVAIMLAAVSATAAWAQASPRPTWVPRQEAMRSWGTMSAQELAAVNRAARRLPSTRVEIICAGNFCRGLAEDLDEALESAGHDAYLELPMFDLGKGGAISPDTPAARQLAAAIKDATAGRVDLKVLAPKDAAGNVVPLKDKILIALGRKPRS